MTEVTKEFIPKNEDEKIIEIEIERLCSFKNHPFQVKDDVLHCLEGNTSKIKNIKKYLLAALFNAPSTISGYYRAEVNHDMPWLAR